MANIFQSVLGEDGVAKFAGNKAGEVVEGVVKSALGGGGEQTKDEKGGLNLGNLLGGNDSQGGINAGDVLSFVGGGKEDGDEGGVDVKKVVGGLFG